MRAVVLALSIGAQIVARPVSAWLTLALAVVSVLVATRLPSRVALGAFGLLMFAAVPWIALPLITGVLWLVIENRTSVRQSQPRSRTRHVRGGIAIALVLGTVAGGIAVLPSRDQMNAHPLQFDVVEPPWWIVWSAIAFFAFANAVGEELLWRGLLLREIGRSPTWLLYALQAVSFGIAHWFGLPGGLLGCVLTAMASLVFLWMHRRWGLLYSIFAHFVADLIIFVSVAPFVVFARWYVG
ncbi:type II CAAX endopeptidase family protein [uncultured Microbacterium sp.]|uniref:type II CAAX endopeptidase family protein n=1 Tax=uncultured Microbacterium sp. TaxID=191216 RepID=UPI0026170CD7|nr:type II CAAX endopeptidase family protein [uncultured Microbacterium sp.]